MSSRRFVLPTLLGLLVGAAVWALFVRDAAQRDATAQPVDDAPSSASDAGPAVSWSDGVARATPSVVSLYSSSSRVQRGSLSRPDTRQGSGVIVASDGLIITNRHLIDGAEVINVALPDGRLMVASVIGEDPETDLALVRVPAEALPALALDAVVPPRVGDIVLAIGNPFGVGQTVTQGIVSAVERRVAGGSVWQDFVQIDAAINPGNSGGALIDTQGRLVGVNTAVFLSVGPPGAGRGDYAGGRGGPGGTSGAGGIDGPGGAAGRSAVRGIGYAIPASVLAHVVPQLLEHGRVTRGWLGIQADDPPVLARDDGSFSALRGALVSRLADQAPARAAGLARGDIVLALDGRAVEDARALLLQAAALAPGSVVDVQVRRDERTLTLRATLGERPDAATRRAQRTGRSGRPGSASG